MIAPKGIRFLGATSRRLPGYNSPVNLLAVKPQYRTASSGCATAIRLMRNRRISGYDLFAWVMSVIRSLRSKVNADGEDNPFGTIGVELFRSIAELPSDAARLLEDAEVAYPEFAQGWFANIEATVFARDPGVRYYLARRAGTPRAILPVHLVKHSGIRRIEALANYYTSLYSPILSPEASTLDLASLLKTASRDHGGAHEMRFMPMDPASPAYTATLAALRSCGWIPFRYFCFGNWHNPIMSNWKAYLDQRSGQLRNTIKRKGRKFAAEGGTIDIVTDPAQVDTAIDAFTQVYSRSWKKPEPYPEFVPGLIRWLSERRWFRLGIARLHDKPIAAQLWIVSHRKARIFKLAYDEAYAHVGAGTLLTAKLMEYAIEQDKVEDVDYLIGDDPYKREWMSNRRERWGIVAYDPKTVIGLALATYEGIRRMVTRSIRGLARRSGPSTHRADHSQGESEKISWKFHPASEFPNLAGKWQSLCESTTNTPLLSADFVGTALRHFAQGGEIICFGERSGKVIAGTIVHKPSKMTWQTFQPSQMPLGPWLQSKHDNLTTLAKSLQKALPGFTPLLSLTQLDSDFYSAGRSPDVTLVDSITTGRVLLQSDLHEFMDSAPVRDNPKLVAELMRRMRKAEKVHGEIELEVETKPEEATAFLNRYAEIESRGWKSAKGSAIKPNDNQARFYADLMNAYARNGAARMYTLRFGTTPVAHQIAILGDGVAILLKTTYDEGFRAFGPGVIQTYRIIKDLIEKEESIRVVEMYGRFNDSQKLWVANTRSIYHVNIYQSSLVASMHRRWASLRTRSTRDEGSPQAIAE